MRRHPASSPSALPTRPYTPFTPNFSEFPKYAPYILPPCLAHLLGSSLKGTPPAPRNCEFLVILKD